MKPLYWFIADMVIVFFVFSEALPTLIKFGPFVGVDVGGICYPQYGAVTCYATQPISLFTYCAFMLVVSFKHPKAAIPLMLFTVPFVEFVYFLVSVDPLHFFFVYAYFQPLFFEEWIILMPLGIALLWVQGMRPRFNWYLVAWVVGSFIFMPFVPYFHTTALSVIETQVYLTTECIAVWLTFFSGSSDSRQYEGGGVISSYMPGTA